MLSHTHATDTQAKTTDLANTILAASSPAEIAAACGAIELFLNKHTPDQTRWFFSITFPTLICKIFGFDESSPAQRPQPPNGWINIAASSDDSKLTGRIFDLLSPHSILLSSISSADRLSLVKYVFPTERLPDWARYMLEKKRDCRVLEDLCPLFKGRLKEDSVKGSSFQVQLNVFEYYMFWFAYYPVCRANGEWCDVVRVQRSKRFKLHNWAYSIPVFSNIKRVTEHKIECNLYVQLLYAYLLAFVPLYDLNAHQPYRSSLLHYSSGYDSSILEWAEFFVNTLIHFWLIDNDFSPLHVRTCKSYDVSFPFRTVLGETPPNSGLGEVVNLLVKYLNLSLTAFSGGCNQAEPNSSPKWKVSNSVDVNSKDVMSGYLGACSLTSWNSWIQRPLYRYILRTFLFSPMETSIKNASQVFTVWINYMEPWLISPEDFAGLSANADKLTQIATEDIVEAPSRGYSSSWESFVLANYLFYSSLVMHFFGFAHKFLHTDAEVIIQMVSKVINILTSSPELVVLIKNVDTVFHSKPLGASKSVLYNLYRYVPTICEQLQDWEDGLCESEADGSFLHENWNKDLRLFSDGEDGGQQLLQLFVLRAESELQAISGENLGQGLQCLDNMKVQLSRFYGASIIKTKSAMPVVRLYEQCHDEIFKPRWVGNRRAVADMKYKGDSMKRPISSDEIAWLAMLLINLSSWLNLVLGLSDSESSNTNPSWSPYMEVSVDTDDIYGSKETIKVLWCSVGAWLMTLGVEAVKFMRRHGLRVNLRILASKKVATVLLITVAFWALKKAFA